MDKWILPTSLNVGGVDYSIRTDYRAVLDAIQALTSVEFDQEERVLSCLDIMYVEFDSMPIEQYEEALEQVCVFIDCGEEHIENSRVNVRLMDWEQDANIIIPAINRVAGKEIRVCEYIHWWTFVGYYMEIGNCTFANIVSIRDKKAKGKKLEDYEEEYYREHRDIIVLKDKITEEEALEEAEINARLTELFG